MQDESQTQTEKNIVAYVIKRDGSKVHFEYNKIVNAISKAFANDLDGQNNARTAGEKIADEVMRTFNLIDEEISIEKIQDFVIAELQKLGYGKESKAYADYRLKHATARLQDDKGKQERVYPIITAPEQAITTQAIEFSRIDNLMRRIASSGDLAITDLHWQDISTLATSYLIPNKDLSIDEIIKNYITASCSFIERDFIYERIAYTLLLHLIYGEADGIFIKDIADFDNLDKELTFANSLANMRERFRQLVNEERLAEHMNMEGLSYEFIKKEITDNFAAEYKLKYLGLQILYDRYLLKNKAGRVLETLQQFWLRVAMGIHLGKASKDLRHEEPSRKILDYYKVIANLRYLPSTPTLFNSGTRHSQMSSCYLLETQDSLDHISKTYADCMQLSKWAGGIGVDWTNVRALNSFIKGTGGKSQGIIPFLRILNDIAVAVNQGGKRRGAICAYLETWHKDILDFLNLKRNTGDERRRTPDMNTANWIPDLFMKRIADDGNWLLLSPNDPSTALSIANPNILHNAYGNEFDSLYRRIEEDYKAYPEKYPNAVMMSAKELWQKMITMLFETGHPWICFKDACNEGSPMQSNGIVHSSNLCTEITLNTSIDETAVCNLGSINLAGHLTNERASFHGLDFHELRKTITLAVEMLDKVIDNNFYPTKEAENSNLRHRPIGLGIMGLQELFWHNDVGFEDDDALEINTKVMEYIAYNAYAASHELSKYKGNFSSFANSQWKQGITPPDLFNDRKNRMLDEYQLEAYPETNYEKGKWIDLSKKAKDGMRNSNVIAIAPTATIANIAGVTNSIEPIFRNIFVESNLSGEFIVINEYLVKELQGLGLWNEDYRDAIKMNNGDLDGIGLPDKIINKYKPANKITQSRLIRLAADRQRFIDQAQSVNLFMPSNVTGNYMSNLYLEAWQAGLKTTYYCRTQEATSTENYSSSSNSKVCKIADPSCEVCQ